MCRCQYTMNIYSGHVKTLTMTDRTLCQVDPLLIRTSRACTAHLSCECSTVVSAYYNCSRDYSSFRAVAVMQATRTRLTGARRGSAMMSREWRRSRGVWWRTPRPARQVALSDPWLLTHWLRCWLLFALGWGRLVCRIECEMGLNSARHLFSHTRLCQ